MRPSGRFIVSTSALRRRLCDRHRRCDAADREICASRNEKGGPQAAFFKMFDARLETANSTCVRTIRPSCRRTRRRRPLSRRLRRPKPSPLHRDTGAMLIVTGATVTIAPRIGSRSRSTGRIPTTTESTGAGYPGRSASDPTPDLDFSSGVICEERKQRSNPVRRCFGASGLVRGACHRATLCADPSARNDGVFVITGWSEGPDPESFPAHLWIPGSLVSLAPRNDGGQTLTSRSASAW
jgi:hypothetical protein